MTIPEESDGAIYERVSNASASPDLRAAVDASLDGAAALAPLCALTHLQALAELQAAQQEIARLRATLKGAETCFNQVITLQAAENLRLEKSLHWEQNWRSRIGIHGPNCHTWGPSHYNCALEYINKLQHHFKKQ